MTESLVPPQVGAPDPELKNSPVLEETDEEFEVLSQEITESAVCYFNGHAFPDGAYVCSGAELLCCRQGSWVRQGSCDPDNP